MLSRPEIGKSEAVRYPMTFEEFSHLARLFVIDALEREELREFETARVFFGPKAEEYLAECRQLTEMMARRLHPIPPNPATREKIMRRVSGRSFGKN